MSSDQAIATAIRQYQEAIREVSRIRDELRLLGKEFETYGSALSSVIVELNDRSLVIKKADVATEISVPSTDYSIELVNEMLRQGEVAARARSVLADAGLEDVVR